LDSEPADTFDFNTDNESHLTVRQARSTPMLCSPFIFGDTAAVPPAGLLG
jgi:hypothetical protein